LKAREREWGGKTEFEANFKGEPNLKWREEPWVIWYCGRCGAGANGESTTAEQQTSSEIVQHLEIPTTHHKKIVKSAASI
jgi:hypothetical protein